MTDIQQLIEQLNGDVKTRETAKQSLIAMGSLAVEPLLAVLNTHESPSFHSVVNILGLIKDPRVAPALVGLLEHPDDKVRFAVVLALGEMRDQRALPVIQDLLDQTISNRWIFLMRALDNLGQRPVMMAFANQVLREGQVSDGDRQVMIHIVSLWNDPAMGDLLLYLLQQRREHFNDAQIAITLAKLKYLPAVGYLIDSLAEDKPQWRGVAAQALGEMGDKRAIEPLKGLLGDKRVAWADDPREGPGQTVRGAAKEALRKLEPAWKIWYWF